MKSGYIKVSRKMLDWGWYKDSNTKAIFLHLLLKASFKGSYFKGYYISPGQCITGRKQLAQDTGLTEAMVRVALKHLENTGEITIKTTNRFSIITIENWAKYQGCFADDDQQENHQIANKSPTDDQQMTTLEECKESNKEKKEESINAYGCRSKEISRTKADLKKAAGIPDGWFKE